MLPCSRGHAKCYPAVVLLSANMVRESLHRGHAKCYPAVVVLSANMVRESQCSIPTRSKQSMNTEENCWGVSFRINLSRLESTGEDDSRSCSVSKQSIILFRLIVSNNS